MPVTPNSPATDYLNSDYQVSFTPADGSEAITNIEGADIGKILTFQVVEDDIVLTTDKGVLTIYDLPFLVPPEGKYAGGEEVDGLLESERDFIADFEAVMKLFLEMARETRDVNREMRNGSRQMMEMEHEAAITEMKSKAAKEFMIGMITNVVSVLSGVLSMGGGFMATRSLKTPQAGAGPVPAAKMTTPTSTGGGTPGGSVRTTNNLPEGVTEGSRTATTTGRTTNGPDKAANSSNHASPTGAEVRAHATTAKWTAGGKILDALAGGTTSFIKHEATSDEEDERRATKNSEIHRMEADDQNEYFRNSRQIINDGMNTLKEMRDSRHRTNSEIISSHV